MHVMRIRQRDSPRGQPTASGRLKLESEAGKILGELGRLLALEESRY